MTLSQFLHKGHAVPANAPTTRIITSATGLKAINDRMASLLESMAPRKRLKATASTIITAPILLRIATEKAESLRVEARIRNNEPRTAIRDVRPAIGCAMAFARG